MKKRDMLVAVVETVVLTLAALLFDRKTATPSADDPWQTEGWATESPGSVGLDEQVSSRWTTIWSRGNIRS